MMINGFYFTLKSFFLFFFFLSRFYFWTLTIHRTEGVWGGGGGGLSLFLQHLYRRDFGVKSEFWVGIGTLGGGNVFQVGLENSQYKKQYKNSIKNSEYNSQAKKKKILIAISTISHFWSPTIKNLW